MPPVETFRTARLLASRLRAGDLDELSLMHRDPRVMATLGGLRSDEESRRFLESSLEHWDRHGHGLWMFRDEADGRFLGRGGLRHVEVGGGHEVEVAYALQADAWGRGLATEMAEALLALAYEAYGLSDLVCFTLTTNRASQRVMEKVGFAFEREIVHADLPHVLYRIALPMRDIDVQL